MGGYRSISWVISVGEGTFMVIYFLFYGTLRYTYVLLDWAVVFLQCLCTLHFSVGIFLVGSMFLYSYCCIVCWRVWCCGWIRNFCPQQKDRIYFYILVLSCLHVKSYIHFLDYAMMIICSLVMIITIYTHTWKKQQKNKKQQQKTKTTTKNDKANTNNYCNVSIQYIYYIPYVLQWYIRNISLTYHNLCKLLLQSNTNHIPT